MKTSLLDSEIRKGAIRLGRGNIISSKDIARNPGDYPIYSSSAKGAGEFGRYGEYMFDEELITWSVDGGGRFFYRPKHRFSVTNVSGYMLVSEEVWDRRFVYYSLDLQHQNLTFDYQTKAHPSIIRYLYELPKFPHQEQTKIAEVLSTVERAIEHTEALISKQQRVKTGLMQDLLTRGIDKKGNPRSEKTHQFKDSVLGRIPEEWEATTVGSHLLKIEQGWSPDCEVVAAPHGQWGILKTTAVVWGGFKDYENKLLPRNLNPLPHYEVKAGDVLMTRGGPNSRVGVVVYVHKTQPQLMLSDKLYRLVPDEVLNPKYLVVALASGQTQSHLSTLKTGLAESQTNISQDIVRRLQILIPHIDEQVLIAEIIHAVDNQSNSYLLQLNKLRSLKTGLMQDLLKGKVRVTTLLNESNKATS